MTFLVLLFIFGVLAMLLAIGIFLLFFVGATVGLVWLIRGFAGVIASSFYIGKHRRGGTMLDRPAEAISAAVSAFIGAILIIAGALDDGFQFSDLNDLEVQGALTTLLGFVAAAVTWYIARRQRDPDDNLASAPDGTVVQVKG